MEPSRPLAARRLQEAIARALGPNAQSVPNDVAGLRRTLSVIVQEKRYALVMFLKHRDAFLTDYEIAEGLRDARSNVARNLHVLLTERVVIARRDPETRIVRFRINPQLMDQLAELFHMGR